MFLYYSCKPRFESEVCATRKDLSVTTVILLHGKFLQFDWLRAVLFQLNLKYLHRVKITNLLLQVVV